MHILYVTTTYPPDNGWGGIGTYAYHMARGMIAIGHSVTVLCGVGPRGPYEATNGNLTILRHIRTDQLRGDALRQQIAQLTQQTIQSGNIDLVEFGEHGCEGLEFQRQNPAFPVVVRLHCSTRLAIYGDDPWYKRLARIFIANAPVLAADQRERESVRLATAVTACSRWVLAANQAAGWVFPRKTHMIYNPIASSDLPRSADDKDYESPLVLSLGRLCRLKGAGLAPRIVDLVAKQVPGVRFEFIGQDCPKGAGSSWNQWIMRKLPDNRHSNVHFAGGVPHPEVIANVLPRHSLAFFASVHETFAYSHVECMQAGLACVIASGGGAQELGDHNTSLIRARRSARDIASALVRLLKDPKLRRQIGAAAQRHVQRTFHTDQIAPQMGAFYSQTLELAQVTKC